MPAVVIVDCKRSGVIVATETYSDGSSQSWSTPVEVNWQNTRVSGVNPWYWKHLIAQGQDATTQLHGQKMTLYIRDIDVEWGSFGGTVTRIRGPWQIYGQPDIGLMVPPSHLYDEAQARAETEFVKQVRQARTKWESGEFLGEIFQTARLLVNPLKSIRGQSVNAGRRIRDIAKRFKGWDKNSDRLQRCTDTYLAYKFGIKPALEDAKGISKAVLAMANGHQRYEVQRLIGTGVAEEAISDVVAGAALSGPANPAVRFTYRDKRKATVRILGGYSVALDRSPEMGFFDQVGLAPDNWVPTLYELFPWSFVIDYFVNAGEVLDAFSLGSVNFNWLLQTNRFERELEMHTCGVEYNPNGPAFATDGHVSLKQSNVSRAKRDNSFAPPLTVKKPSLSQSLNIAALVNTIQSLKRGSGN